MGYTSEYAQNEMSKANGGEKKSKDKKKYTPNKKGQKKLRTKTKY